MIIVIFRVERWYRAIVAMGHVTSIDMGSDGEDVVDDGGRNDRDASTRKLGGREIGG